MGQDKKRILGIVPVKSVSERFPMKNFHIVGDKPLWKHSYDLLTEICDKTITAADCHLECYNVYRNKNAAVPDASVLDVLRFAYMNLSESYDIVVCLFANTVDFVYEDINDGIDLMLSNNLQEVRGFNFDGVENGLLIFRTERLFNPPGISSYLGCVVSAGREIHYREELE